MKFVLDTNIILKALIRDSVVRGIILGSGHELLIPEHAIHETREHLDTVVKKSGLSESEVNSILDVLLANVAVVPADQVMSKWKDAEEIMRQVDEDDVPFVAASMAVGCDGIWSDDKHLRRQNKVKVWTTKHILGLGSRA